jgi:hypothetical protein
MIVDITKPVQVDIRTLKISMKVRDTFQCKLKDENDNIILNYEGYVPDFMPDDHFGDYIYLNIDIETGQILNWYKPSAQELSKFIQNQIYEKKS